jgi:hypothetical protein
MNDRRLRSSALLEPRRGACVGKDGVAATRAVERGAAAEQRRHQQRPLHARLEQAARERDAGRVSADLVAQRSVRERAMLDAQSQPEPALRAQPLEHEHRAELRSACKRRGTRAPLEIELFVPARDVAAFDRADSDAARGDGRREHTSGSVAVVKDHPARRQHRARCADGGGAARHEPVHGKRRYGSTGLQELSSVGHDRLRKSTRSVSNGRPRTQ